MCMHEFAHAYEYSFVKDRDRDRVQGKPASTSGVPAGMNVSDSDTPSEFKTQAEKMSGPGFPQNRDPEKKNGTTQMPVEFVSGKNAAGITTTDEPGKSGTREETPTEFIPGNKNTGTSEGIPTSFVPGLDKKK